MECATNCGTDARKGKTVAQVFVDQAARRLWFSAKRV
jgi:hypothetical protein